MSVIVCLDILGKLFGADFLCLSLVPGRVLGSWTGPELTEVNIGFQIHIHTRIQFLCNFRMKCVLSRLLSWKFTEQNLQNIVPEVRCVVKLTFTCSVSLLVMSSLSRPPEQPQTNHTCCYMSAGVAATMKLQLLRLIWTFLTIFLYLDWNKQPN